MGLVMISYKPLVVHITPTPLVGAPYQISNAINSYAQDFESVVLCLNDYPSSLAGVFPNQMIFFNKKNYFLIERILAKASIIHIHNFYDGEIIKNISKVAGDKNKARFIYQVHSPTREGPIFYDNFTSFVDVVFDKKFVVGQYQPRLYQDFIPVPNIVGDSANISIAENDAKTNILFSPAHNRTGGRWNDKYSKTLDEAMLSIQQLQLANIIQVSNVNQYELFNLRKQCQISIDEIVTGGFHQISLEALACGNAVINNADCLSMMQLSYFAKNHELPPFINANENSINKVLTELLFNKDKLAYYQQSSFDYFNKNLRVEHLINFYLDEYRELV